MRKQTKLVAVLSAAALLAIGATMTSFAAWTKSDDGTWQYIDRDGEKVSGEWQKDGSKFFYLDDDGNMLTDSWVEDTYYVGNDGAMVVNDWRKLAPADGEDDPEGYGEYWYYFGGKGKKTGDGTATDKKIGGKYYFFDETGKMRDGWYPDEEGNYYYLGEENDGARASGWLWLDNWENDTDLNVDDCDLNCDDEGWYYFNTSSGKMTNSEKRKKINGKYYYFNADGQMLYQWIDSSATAPVADYDLEKDATPAEIDDMRYANDVEEGWEGGGWYQVDGSTATGTDKDTKWFYFKDGKAKTADAAKDGVIDDEGNEVDAIRARIKITGKYFCFNEKGQMQTGLQRVGNAFYYFDENGYMKSGKVSNVEEDDDDTYTYYFETKSGGLGKGVTGPKSGYLYWNGKRLEANDDYKLYNVNGLKYIVNNSGKIQKTTTKTYSIENKNELDGELKAGGKDGFAITFTKDGALTTDAVDAIGSKIEAELPQITLYEESESTDDAVWTTDSAGKRTMLK